MKKLILTTIVLAVTMFVAGTAEAARRRCRNYVVQSAPVAAPVATAQAQPGYRAFSYQPTGVVVQPTYRARPAQPAYFNAGRKILGQY